MSARVETPNRSAVASRVRHVGRWSRAHARTLGRASVWAVPVGVLLQIVSFVQQALHLFSPAPGERPFVIGVFVVVVLVGIAGVAAGMLAAPTVDGRRMGVFGAALGGATLVLFLIASAAIWNLLIALG